MQRKDTLLHEYRQSKKANAFIDRRFGESDASLAEDDKAIMRYQKERLSQLSKRSRFNLKDDDVSDGEEELLMHRGVAAGADEFDEGDVPGEDDEDNPERESLGPNHQNRVILSVSFTRAAIVLKTFRFEVLLPSRSFSRG